MTPDQAENALIAFVIVLAALCLMCGVAWAGCGINEREEITSGDPLTMNVCASVTAYCNTGSEYVKCEDIPVYELQPEDYQEPPTPAEQWASAVAWREQGE